MQAYCLLKGVGLSFWCIFESRLIPLLLQYSTYKGSLRSSEMSELGVLQFVRQPGLPKFRNLGLEKFRHYFCRGFNLSDKNGKCSGRFKFVFFCKNGAQYVKKSNYYLLIFIKYIQIFTLNPLKKQILDAALFFPCFLPFEIVPWKKLAIIEA